MSAPTGRVRAICFDLDGTLLRPPNVDDVMRQVTTEIAFSHRIDAVELANGNRRAWAQHWPLARDAWLRGQIPLKSVSFNVWRLSLADVGIFDDGLLQRTVDRFAELETATFELYPEAFDVLLQVRARGIRTALITNGSRDYQRGKLAAVGLDGFDGFDAIIVSGELGVAKPSQEIFAAALDALGVVAAEAWHVGDDQRADVAGARDAGLCAVWLDRLGAPLTVDPHETITDLRGLLGLLDSKESE